MTGLPGPAGLNGINGTNGIDGVTGLPGPAGLNGINGTNGIDGVTGIQGLPGLDGLTGATGFPGQNGFDGAIGPTGPGGTPYWSAAGDGICYYDGDNTMQIHDHGAAINITQPVTTAQVYYKGTSTVAVSGVDYFLLPSTMSNQQCMYIINAAYEYQIVFSSPASISYYLAGAGGGGGYGSSQGYNTHTNEGGGGGGGGKLINGSFETPIDNTIYVTLGIGGLGSETNTSYIQTSATGGSSSSITGTGLTTLTATGGGAAGNGGQNYGGVGGIGGSSTNYGAAGGLYNATTPQAGAGLPITTSIPSVTVCGGGGGGGASNSNGSPYTQPGSNGGAGGGGGGGGGVYGFPTTNPYVSAGALGNVCYSNFISQNGQSGGGVSPNVTIGNGGNGIFGGGGGGSGGSTRYNSTTSYNVPFFGGKGGDGVAMIAFVTSAVFIQNDNSKNYGFQLANSCFFGRNDGYSFTEGVFATYPIGYVVKYSETVATTFTTGARVSPVIPPLDAGVWICSGCLYITQGNGAFTNSGFVQIYYYDGINLTMCPTNSGSGNINLNQTFVQTNVYSTSGFIIAQAPTAIAIVTGTGRSGVVQPSWYVSMTVGTTTTRFFNFYCVKIA